MPKALHFLKDNGRRQWHLLAFLLALLDHSCLPQAAARVRDSARWILILTAVLVLFAEWVAGNSSGAGVGWWIVLAGVGCVGLGKVGAWWYHG